MKEDAPLTAKEFSSEVLGGKRCARWVRAQCRLWIQTEGLRGIAVLSPGRPYLIPASEKERFRHALSFKRWLQAV